MIYDNIILININHENEEFYLIEIRIQSNEI